MTITTIDEIKNISFPEFKHIKERQDIYIPAREIPPLDER